MRSVAFGFRAILDLRRQKKGSRAMTIHLSKELAQFIHDAVRAGFYVHEDDVIRDALVRLKRALPKRARASGKRAKHAVAAERAPADSEETAFDVASRAGLIGCVKGARGSPTDLSTNPRHMEGFGRD
jgi:Arc/MetJ-type ribon-helix-helix transcriptional regulator